MSLTKPAITIYSNTCDNLKFTTQKKLEHFKNIFINTYLCADGIYY